MSSQNEQMLFPRSRVNEFHHTDTNLRYGQAFHQFAQLHKCEQDKEFCDRLYEANDETARKMIASRIDELN